MFLKLPNIRIPSFFIKQKKTITFEILKKRNAYFFRHMRARASAATKPSGSAHYKGRMGCVPIWKTQARLPLQRSHVVQHISSVEWDTASIESRLKALKEDVTY